MIGARQRHFRSSLGTLGEENEVTSLGREEHCDHGKGKITVDLSAAGLAQWK